jgi:hypothetical protein
VVAVDARESYKLDFFFSALVLVLCGFSAGLSERKLETSLMNLTTLKSLHIQTASYFLLV